MKSFRNLSVFLAAAALLFFTIETWIGVKIPQQAMDIVNMAAGVLVALGILCDTGENPQPITKESLIEKLKSPVAVGAIFALISYIMYQQMNYADADTVLKILDTLIVGVFGFSVYNNPNDRERVR